MHEIFFNGVLRASRGFFKRVSELKTLSLSGYEEPISLREGETAQRVSIEGMDALLITAEDPDYPDGLLLQRKIVYPVQLKLLPLHDHMEESDDNSYQYEYIVSAK